MADSTQKSKAGAKSQAGSDETTLGGPDSNPGQGLGQGPDQGPDQGSGQVPGPKQDASEEAGNAASPDSGCGGVKPGSPATESNPKWHSVTGTTRFGGLGLLTDGKIILPAQLIEPLDVKPGSMLSAVYYPSAYARNNATRAEAFSEICFADLVLAPIDFEYWNRIAILELSLHSRAGTIKSVLKIVRDQKWSVIACDFSRSAYRYGTLRLVVAWDGSMNSFPAAGTQVKSEYEDLKQKLSGILRENRGVKQADVEQVGEGQAKDDQAVGELDKKGGQADLEELLFKWYSSNVLESVNLLKDAITERDKELKGPDKDASRKGFLYSRKETNSEEAGAFARALPAVTVRPLYNLCYHKFFADAYHADVRGLDRQKDAGAALYAPFSVSVEDGNKISIRESQFRLISRSIATTLQLELEPALVIAESNVDQCFLRLGLVPKSVATTFGMAKFYYSTSMHSTCGLIHAILDLMPDQTFTWHLRNYHELHRPVGEIGMMEFMFMDTNLLSDFLQHSNGSSIQADDLFKNTFAGLAERLRRRIEEAKLIRRICRDPNDYWEYVKKRAGEGESEFADSLLKEGEDEKSFFANAIEAWRTLELLSTIDDLSIEGINIRDLQFRLAEEPYVDRPMYDVFVSYSFNDEAKLTRLRDALEAAGLTYYMAKGAMRAGDEIESEILRKLRSSRSMVLVVSSDYLDDKKHWMRVEYGMMLGLNRRVFPLMLDVREAELPSYLQERRHAYWYGLDLKKFVSDIRTYLRTG